MTTFTEVRNPFQGRPAYRYIRRTDRMPTYADLAGVELSEITAKVRLFNPTGAGTWHIAAYDPETGIAWGVADIQVRELGGFSMDEIVGFRGFARLPIERDLWYTPRSVADILANGD